MLQAGRAISGDRFLVPPGLNVRCGGGPEGYFLHSTSPTAWRTIADAFRESLGLLRYCLISAHHGNQEVAVAQPDDGNRQVRVSFEFSDVLAFRFG